MRGNGRRRRAAGGLRGERAWLQEKIEGLGWLSEEADAVPQTAAGFLQGLRSTQLPMEQIRRALPGLRNGELSAAARRAAEHLEPGFVVSCVHEMAVLGIWHNPTHPTKGRSVSYRYRIAEGTSALTPVATALLVRRTDYREQVVGRTPPPPLPGEKIYWGFRWHREPYGRQASCTTQELALSRAAGRNEPIRVFAERPGHHEQFIYLGYFDCDSPPGEVHVSDCGAVWGQGVDRCRYFLHARPGSLPLPGEPDAANTVRVFSEGGGLLAEVSEEEAPFTTLGLLCQRVQLLAAVRECAGEGCRVWLVFRPPDPMFATAAEAAPEMRVRLTREFHKEALQYLRCPDARLVVTPCPTLEQLATDCSEGQEEIQHVADCDPRVHRAIEAFGYTSRFVTPRTRILADGKSWRIVQPKRISLPLRLCFVNGVVGCGLRFVRSHPKGSYVGPMTGLLVRRESETEQVADGRYTVSLPVPGTDLQQGSVGNLLRFANHATKFGEEECAGKRRMNARLDTVTQGQDGAILTDAEKAGLGLYLTQDVEEGDELCWDYGNDYWEPLGIQPLGDQAAYAAIGAACVAAAKTVAAVWHDAAAYGAPAVGSAASDGDYRGSDDAVGQGDGQCATDGEDSESAGDEAAMASADIIEMLKNGEDPRVYLEQLFKELRRDFRSELLSVSAENSQLKAENSQLKAELRAQSEQLADNKRLGESLIGLGLQLAGGPSRASAAGAASEGPSGGSSGAPAAKRARADGGAPP
eukprot:TRINITY_DN51611_c0_g1_i1.p1 TRINITY_DN51611_c0_g1~~TRINITY_DN51611_c0_g1_i1.p1  ORF type:complete len:753 (+),score=181.64 TRINITY_DN51611_c0_g1_i1:129-2387(+)